MGVNTNTGQLSAMTVYGNPESFKKIIRSHGQLCKIKQTIVCPCVAKNNGSPDFNCNICSGDGYVYTYQRRCYITDENSTACGKTVFPFFNPVIDVTTVQDLNSAIQGGITTYTVESFNDTEITLSEEIGKHTLKRVTYAFDGWTYVPREKLRVDVTNKLMYADGTKYDSGYQSSNPLNACADIAKVVKIWNDATGIELTSFIIEGNVISTTSASLDADNMYIEYYYSDLTQVITTDLVNRENNEVFSHDIKSGECKMAFFPYWELSKGDLIVIAATVLYKNEQVQHTKNLDKLWEIEVYSLNDKIIDESGNIYEIDTDYVLQGRHIKWIGNKPIDGAFFSIRYGYKPAYIIFEDNPQPNNLENKLYPIIVLAKSWSKINKNDIARLITA